MAGARRNGRGAFAERVPVFISASSREGKRARVFAEALEGSGIVKIEDRWFADCESWARTDARYTREQQSEIAEYHEAYIKRARVFWLLHAHELSEGSIYEYGFARAHQAHVGNWWTHIVVTGPHVSRCVFTSRADVRDCSDFVGLHAVIARAHEILSRAHDDAEAAQ